MKSAVLLLACAVLGVATAQNFLQQPQYSSQYRTQFQSQFKPQYQQQRQQYPPQYESAQYTATAATPVAYAKSYVKDARSASILKYGNEINPDGSYNYFFETDNGIAAQQQGTPRSFGGNPPLVPVVAQGSFSWTSPEGQPIAISYVADENGYQPQGDAIPTPHPIPPQIARSLEYIARNTRA